MKKSTGIILLFLLVLAAFPLASHAAPSQQQTNWRAEYYDNASLSGQPIISRIEANISQDWGAGSPALDIPSDRFSGRWTSRRHFEKGSYLFLLTVDDGARVWLDGKLIIDAWDIGHKERRKARVRINKTGEHEVQVAYFENTGKASIHLEWIQLGGEDDIVGAWHGQYYNNKNLEGDPVVTRQDGGIRFDWSTGSPDAKVSRDNFSVRWTRSVYLKEGQYHFRIQHDDGMRVYVDGKIIYDSWFDQSVTYKTAVVPLKEGYRTFMVEYYDHVGNAVAQVQIDEDPGDYDEDDTESDGVGLVVDNSDSNFEWHGPIARRSIGRGGYSGDHFWTRTSGNQTVNFGRWEAPISRAGNYEVFAYIPANNSTTTNARYRIYHFGRFVDRRLDQSRHSNQFVSLGIYYFDGTSEEFVTLVDSSGEAEGSTKIAFDAMKFVQR